MNSGGWRYLPPVLQTKHNFYLCSDLWLVQGLRRGRVLGRGCCSISGPALGTQCSRSCPRGSPAALRFMGGRLLLSDTAGFQRNPSTHVNYCYLYPLGPGPPACLLQPECAEILIPFLPFFLSLFFFLFLFTSALICILSSVQRPLK